jgi:hypothetical protein
MIIQTILLYPSGDDQIDAAHSPRNRKVVGSNPTSGSTNQQVRVPNSACLHLPCLLAASPPFLHFDRRNTYTSPASHHHEGFRPELRKEAFAPRQLPPSIGPVSGLEQRCDTRAVPDNRPPARRSRQSIRRTQFRGPSQMRV